MATVVVGSGWSGASPCGGKLVSSGATRPRSVPIWPRGESTETVFDEVGLDFRKSRVLERGGGASLGCNHWPGDDGSEEAAGRGTPRRPTSAADNDFAIEKNRAPLSSCQTASKEKTASTVSTRHVLYIALPSGHTTHASG